MARRPQIESSGFYHSKKVKSQTLTPRYFEALFFYEKVLHPKQAEYDTPDIVQ